MADTHVHTSCPGCSKSYRLKRALFSARTMRVKCRMCSFGFTVENDRRELQIWVFSDDPAFAIDGVLERFQHPLHNTEVIDAPTRRAMASLPDSVLPDVVVFGGMHVILEDAMVSRCARHGCKRLLVSTHLNDELIETAQSFCGVDHHMTVPIEATLVDLVLDDVLEPAA